MALRNYAEAGSRVQELYRAGRSFHSLETAARLSAKHRPTDYSPVGVWNALAVLERFQDLSDPDVDEANMHHALQTAESMRAEGLPDWMQLAGLIHDFGKLLFLTGCDEDGTSLSTQWSIVGDTYVLGVPLPPDMVYPEFNSLAPEQHAGLGVYAAGCGLDRCVVSYGHDEFLHSALTASRHQLPDAALRAIRYHSLYPWHQGGHYVELESVEDVEGKRWVQMLNAHDLYSKTDRRIALEDVRPHYQRLIDKYLPEGINFGGDMASAITSILQ